MKSSDCLMKFFFHFWCFNEAVITNEGVRLVCDRTRFIMQSRHCFHFHIIFFTLRGYPSLINENKKCLQLTSSRLRIWRQEIAKTIPDSAQDWIDIQTNTNFKYLHYKTNGLKNSVCSVSPILATSKEQRTIFYCLCQV